MDICVERIVQLLTENSLNNKTLSEYLSIPSSAISDWKSGKTTSYNKYIGEISEFFGVSADFILGRTPIRTGTKWDELIKQYQLCDEEKLKLVDRLLGLTREYPNDSTYCHRLAVEEDMSTILELVSMFDKLSLVGKSRVIAVAADELDKIK
jgi:transcriptional regulator with XRE-family HTH domain